MNEFRTTVKIPESNLSIDHRTPLAMIGSCFTDNVGKRMQRYKFPIDINPFGVIYNPASVSKSLGFIAAGTQFGKVDLQYANGQWFSFHHHTSFSHSDANKALQQINSRLARATEFMRKANALFITLGTSWVYEHKKAGIIVSNNHKLPSNQFHRYRLDVEQIVNYLAGAITKLRTQNPGLQVIFTISPIRYWKDGPAENQLSKATLIVAVHQLIEKLKNTDYFPAYEIMMDDLRDYRFYNDDMIHLSNTAVQYIWDKFRKVYISSQAEHLMRKLEKIVKATEHKPFNHNSDRFKEFARNSLSRIEQLQKQFPFLDFSEEIHYFQSYIK